MFTTKFKCDVSFRYKVVKYYDRCDNNMNIALYETNISHMTYEPPVVANNRGMIYAIVYRDKGFVLRDHKFLESISHSYTERSVRAHCWMGNLRRACRTEF